VDLSEPRIEIVVKGGAESAEALPPGSVAGTHVSGFVRRNGLLAGINANPFDTVSEKEGEKLKVVGLMVSDGVLVALPNPRFDALVFYADGTAAIVDQGSISAGDIGSGPGGPIVNAAGGFHAILLGGALTARTGQTKARHPRSAAGLSDKGRLLYLLVIDGRRPDCVGATEAETAIILSRLGAVDGINFDGGGSTALALRLGDGAVRTVNTPGGISNRERAVASCIGIGIKNGK
jgi:exopolysaccharide biosynthesis protein